jgi:hypothetical protein
MDNLAIDDLETAFRANLCEIHKQSVEETQEHMEWVAVVLVQIYGKGDADWNDFLDRVCASLDRLSWMMRFARCS